MPSEILFVDPESKLLKALRRSFHRDEEQWRVHFASDARQALENLAAHPIDILVTEIRLPGQDGLALLNLVRRQYPGIARIIFSGYASRETVLQSVGIAHQYIAKPADDEIIKATLKNALILRDLLSNPTLKEMVAKIGSLPSLPSLYVEITDELQSNDPSLQRIAAIVAQDPTMAAKLLQLVNSSFFGLPQQISNLSKAVSLLGTNLIQAVVLSSGVFKRFGKVNLPGFSVDALWQHSLATGACARSICQAEKLDRSIVDTAFMAGLLHDIGKILLATKLPKAFAQVLAMAREQGAAVYAIEQEISGASHAEVGAYLLGLWGLPQGVFQTVAYHHNPAEAPGDDPWPLAAVHLANTFLASAANIPDDIDPTRFDVTFLARFKLGGKIDSWREHCIAHADDVTW